MTHGLTSLHQVTNKFKYKSSYKYLHESIRTKYSHNLGFLLNRSINPLYTRHTEFSSAYCILLPSTNLSIYFARSINKIRFQHSPKSPQFALGE